MWRNFKTKAACTLIDKQMEIKMKHFIAAFFMTLITTNLFAKDSFDYSKATKLAKCYIIEKDCNGEGRCVIMADIYESHYGETYIKVTGKSLHPGTYGEQVTFAEAYTMHYTDKNGEIKARTMDYNIIVNIHRSINKAMISFNTSKEGLDRQVTFSGGSCDLFY